MSVKPRKMDYHIHSNFSVDGRQSIFEACQKALLLGLDEICFTEHIEVHHPDMDGGNIVPDFMPWLREINRAKEAFPILEVRSGIEIGDHAPYRQDLYAILAPLEVDFFLLSLHLLNGIDPFDTTFYQGKRQEDVYRSYLEYRLESVRHFSDFDAFAHLGYVGKFAPYPKESRPLSLYHGEDLLDEILKTLAQKGKALEINSSGLRQTASPIPGSDIIKRFITLGGEFFTFCSDAHGTEQLYLHVDQAKEIAIAQGAKWEMCYNNRKPTPIPLL